MPASLKVNYYRSPTCKSQVYAYALRVKVEEATDMPSKIFVYQRGVGRVNNGNHVDSFMNIASPVDMDNVPEDEPLLDDNIPYYRTDEVILYFRCLSDLEETKEDIDRDISTLVKTYNYIGYPEQFNLEETKVYD